jgi:hypothetical protein
MLHKSIKGSRVENAQTRLALHAYDGLRTKNSTKPGLAPTQSKAGRRPFAQDFTAKPE